MDQAGAPAESSEPLCDEKREGETAEGRPGVAAECAEPGELPAGLRERSELVPLAEAVPDALPKSRPGHELNMPGRATGAEFLAEATARVAENSSTCVPPLEQPLLAKQLLWKLCTLCPEHAFQVNLAFQALKQMHTNFVTNACGNTLRARVL